jgi:phosphopantetheinyl transferase (holo-ACP synthase)
LLRLHAEAKRVSQALGLSEWSVSLSHTHEHAMAIAVAWTSPESEAGA